MRRLKIFRADATVRFGFEGIEAVALIFRLNSPKNLSQRGVGLRHQSWQSLFAPRGRQDSPDGAQGSIVFTMNLTNRGKEVH